MFEQRVTGLRLIEQDHSEQVLKKPPNTMHFNAFLDSVYAFLDSVLLGTAKKVVVIILNYLSIFMFNNFSTLSRLCTHDYLDFGHIYDSSRGRGRSIIGGAHIHIFVFTDHKNNRFQKALMMHNTNI